VYSAVIDSAEVSYEANWA